jgi:hypothetical protein
VNPDVKLATFAVSQIMSGITLHQVRYQGSGTFQVPALASDQLTITLTGSNSMTRHLKGRSQVRGKVAIPVEPESSQGQWGYQNARHPLGSLAWCKGQWLDHPRDPLVRTSHKTLLLLQCA